jgi:hypothetical protein
MLRRNSLAFLTCLSLGALASAQESRALFDAALVELDPQNRIEHLVEVDGTPGPEALSWWWEDSKEDFFNVRCWDIDAQNGFTLLWETVLDNQGVIDVTLAPAAIDGGGAADDLFVINEESVRVHIGGRAGAPNLVQTLAAAGRVAEAFALDLSGNGGDDLVTVNTIYQVKIYSNGGSAAGWALSPEPGWTNLGAGTSRVRVAELTGDQTPDLLFVRDDAIVIQPLAADFSMPAEITFPLTTPYVMPIPVAGDIDGDGDDDVVVFACDPTTMKGVYTVLRRDGPASFLHESLAIGGPATDLVDLDGDGDLDGACCSSGGGISSPYSWQNKDASTFELCHNDGTGAFTPSFQLRGLGAERLAAAADVDLDGDVDLVAGRVVYYAPAPITAPFVVGLTSGEHHARVLRDWDGDGDADLRVGYEEVKRADGNGHFAAMAPEMMPVSVPGLTFKGPGYAGDFDGDGDDDLLVAKYKDGTFRKMRVLVNSGGGQFSEGFDASDPGVSFSKTGNDYLDPRGAYSVDYDGDGDVDLFTWDPDSIYPGGSLWQNDGSGYFQQWSPPNGFVAHFPQGVGDFNGDGIRDVLTTHYSGRLYVHIGDGTGNFATTKSVDPDAEINGPLGSVGIGDFDNDGDKDLIACDSEYNAGYRAYAFVNNGNAGFTRFDLGLPGPFSSTIDSRVLIADVNGDGWSDAIVSNIDSARSAAGILLRNSHGGWFQPAFEQVLRPTHGKDLDGDGDLDVVDGSFKNDPLRDDRIVMNRAAEGASAGWRLQTGDGVAGEAGFTPTLGARTFGGFAKGDSIKFLLTGAAPGTTGRLIINEVGTTAATAYTVTPSGWGTLPADRDVTKNFTRVIDFVTSGALGGEAGSGKWDTRDVIPTFFAGRTFHYEIEIDDPLAPGGVAKTNELFVRFADEQN